MNRFGCWPGPDTAEADMDAKQGAVFLDRDGTLNEEVNYLSRMEQLRLYPQTVEAVRLINAAGMKAVVVTNQSGIARGYFTEDFVCRVHTRINELLAVGGPASTASTSAPITPFTATVSTSRNAVAANPSRGCCCGPRRS